MEREQGWQGRYEAPWLLMLGNETEGEQLCATWRLLPVARPAWFGRWWSDGEGAILLVPESVFLPDEGLRRQSGAWLRLLRLFLRLRGRRALDRWSGTFRWRGCRMASRRPTSASPPVVATWN